MNSIDSLVDLLKFINTDTEAYLIKCPKIQKLIKASFGFVRKSGKERKKEKENKRKQEEEK